MLKEEWLNIGYEKGLIDDISESEWVPFSDVYRAWFMTKINRIKPQSVDRIEVTYNKYYRFSNIVDLPVHSIDENVVIQFLNDIVVGTGNITQKEYARIFQIVNNVMRYGFDTKRGHCYCVNWDSVKRYSYNSEFLAYDGADTILVRSLERTLKRLCCLCEVAMFNSHRIRKTFSSELHRNGVPMRMISDVMGHADIRTTEQNYIISYSDTLQVIRKAMEGGLIMSLRKRV